VIYFYHIQRTGGRSLVASILNQFGDPNLWGRCMGSEGPKQIVECAAGQIVPWCADPMSVCPDFWFSWSHVPAHQFELPPQCFTITILRDPVDRFLSYYRFLRTYDDPTRVYQPVHFNALQYLRPTVLETAEAFPPMHRYQMLYHFSEVLDANQAAARIRRLSYRFPLELFDLGLSGLGSMVNMSLNPVHRADSIPPTTNEKVKDELTAEVRNQLVQIFQPEYALLEELGL